MKTIYSTTRPRFSDTKAIAYEKWLQVKAGNAADDGSGFVQFDDTEVRTSDTKLITLQKILQASQ